MMTKMEFVEIIKDGILDYLPEHIIADRKVQVVTALKHNDQERVGITLLGSTDVISGPNFYLEDAYQDYLEYGDLEGIFKDVAASIVANWQDAIPPVLTSLSLESVKDKIFFTVVDKDRNEKLLSCCPHYIDECGLAFIYSIMVEDCGRAVINNELAAGEHYNIEELYAVAKLNTKKLFTPILEPVSKAVLRVKDKFAVPENLLTAEDPVADDVMYMLSNDKFFFGANALFVDGVKEKISEILDGDFYAIPSSCHEWMIVGNKEGIEANKLQEMLIMGNMQVDSQEILSDNVYRYSREANALIKVDAV